jgi:hypothetical protein
LKTLYPKLIKSLLQQGASPEEALSQAAAREALKNTQSAKNEGDADRVITPDMEPAILLFLGADTQWRSAGMSGMRVGLDYTALPIVAQALGVVLDTEVFSDLKVIESGALGELAARAQREKG